MNSKVLRRPIVVANAVGTVGLFLLWYVTGEGTALFAFAIALVGAPMSLALARDELAREGMPDPPVQAHQLRRSIELGAVFTVAALAALFAIDLSRSGFQLFLPAFFFVWFGILAAICIRSAIWIYRRLH